MHTIAISGVGHITFQAWTSMYAFSVSKCAILFLAYKMSAKFDLAANTLGQCHLYDGQGARNCGAFPIPILPQPKLDQELIMLTKWIGPTLKSLPFAIGVMWITACSSSFPNCEDSVVKESATNAIRDAYTRVGRSGFENLGGLLDALETIDSVAATPQTDSMRRVSANILSIPVENLRICRAQLGDTDSYIVIQIAKSNDGDIGYVVSNIGWPGLTGGLGWVTQLP